jgi:hypothetical protein
LAAPAASVAVRASVAAPALAAVLLGLAAVAVLSPAVVGEILR